MPKPTDRDRARVEGQGLRGADKQQAGLRPVDASFGDPTRGDPAETQQSPHQAGQHGADVRGAPAMVQSGGNFPEGLARPRKGSYDKDVGRNEAADHVPQVSKRND
jgi:hypothetical protein